MGTGHTPERRWRIAREKYRRGKDACKSGSAVAGWVQSRGWESIAQMEVLRGRGRARIDTGLVGSERQRGLTRRIGDPGCSLPDLIGRAHEAWVIA